MTTASPIPASLATACAAHDRHRLDVIDALLDEAAPSAVRELLGAALDLCASLRADRDTLAAKLDATPKVCAIHSYALEGPCMTCGAPWPGAEKALRQERVEGMEKMLRISRAVGCPNSVEEVVEAVAAIKADLASERAHLAACRTRIAGLEQAANERSAEVARLAARVAELEAETRISDQRLADQHDKWAARVAELDARPVLTVEAAVAAAKSAGWSSSACRDAETVVGAILAALGPVTLPAQDRAEELANAYVDEWNGNGDCRGDAQAIAKRTAAMRRALAPLGAPPTSPPAAIEMRLCEARRLILKPGLYRFTVDPECSMCVADDAESCSKEGATVAPPEVFAGVSVDELARVSADAYDGSSDQVGDADHDAIRAVLARLGATLVAPVDPEVVARAYHDHKDAPAPEWDEVDAWRGRDLDEQSCAIAAMRATLTAAGIPVTPEVRK